MIRERLFPVAESAVRILTDGARAVHHGVWLGLLDRELLHRVTARYYQAWGFGHDQSCQLGGLQPWEEAVVARHLGGCRSVLIGAAGAGREAIALARRGLEVTAFDCSPELLAECARNLRAEGLDVALLPSLPDRVPETAGRHDAAIVGWGGYMHIQGRATRIAFLHELHARLAPGGPLLVSFFARREGGRSFRTIRAVAAAIRRARGCGEPVELGDTLSETFDHWFSEGEIRSELEEAGFDVVLVADEPYGHAVARARP